MSAPPASGDLVSPVLAWTWGLPASAGPPFYRAKIPATRYMYASNDPPVQCQAAHNSHGFRQMLMAEHRRQADQVSSASDAQLLVLLFTTRGVEVMMMLWQAKV